MFRSVCFIAICLLQFCLLPAQLLQAQDQPKPDKLRVLIQLRGIVDKDTGREIEDSWAELYVLPDTISVGKFQKRDSIYSIRFSAKPGWKYIVRVGAGNPFTQRGFYDKQSGKAVKYKAVALSPITIPDKPNTPQGYVRFRHGTVRLSRTEDSEKPTMLKELTVTASKVKFYHKGDTLVYNADAFVLPEGSMLDVLVARLPGVELHRDGRIYCNGRFVEELLLNGRDLFNGDRKLMLQNLASYTVKDIALYDKLGRNSELFGADTGDSHYVMDVRLKREYAMGLLGNAEIGAAIGDRYLGRFFAMWYNDKASIMLHAGANNMTELSQAGMSNDVWRPSSPTNRDSRFQNGGLSYTWNDGGWDIKGSVKYDGAKLSDESETRQINFFDTGDTYSYKWDDRLSRKMSIETKHAIFKTIADRANISLVPSFTYQNNKNRSNLIDGSFSGEIKDMSRQLLTDIYTTDGAAADSMIYRSLNESMSKGRHTDIDVSAGSFITLTRPTPEGSRGSSLNIRAGFRRNDTRDYNFNRYVINRGADPVPDNMSYQYRDGSPNTRSSYTADIRYENYLCRALQLSMTYAYAHNRDKLSSMLYHLEGVSGFDAVNSVLGYLPSMREYAPTLDPELSYRSQMREHSNKISPELRYNYQGKNNLRINADFNGSFEILSRNYTYLQPALDRTQHLTPVDYLYGLSGNIVVSHSPRGKWARMFQAGLRINTSVKDLYSMIDVDNNADPLNIYKGNPDLKNGMVLSGNIMADFRKPGARFRHSLRMNFSVYFNQLAKGFEYNRETGVRTYKTYNVNGNRNMTGSYTLNVAFGKGFNLNSMSEGNLRNSVDLIGTEGSGEQLPPKREVRILNLRERLRLSWSKDATRLSANFTGGRTSYSSPDPGIIAQTAWTYGGGLAAEISLPYGWGLSTDISLQGRSGYNDSRLNTSDVIWNARITKTAFKGKILFIIDGYDMLNQYNNVNYIVNAQAKIEQITAVIPRYVLFHIQYRFNKQPKKPK